MIKFANLLLKSIQNRLILVGINISFILLIISIWNIKWLVVDVDDFLGLTSHLPAVYWIGLGLITICSIFAYLDEKSKSKIVPIYILLILVLYLFGIGLFAEENARNVFTYSNIAEINNIQSVHRIDISSDYPLISYRSWPAYHLLTFPIISICNIEIKDLIKYIPLFFVMYYLLFCMAIGHTVNFNKNNSFLIGYLFITSIFSAHQWYPSPQSLALCMYVLLFYIILLNFLRDHKINIQHKLVLLASFAAVIMTHLLTSTILLFSFIAESFYQRKKEYVSLLFVMYLAYLAYLAPVGFRYGIRNVYSQMVSMDLFYFVGTTKFVPVTHIKETVNYFRLAYILIYILIILIILFYVYKDTNQKRIQVFKFCLFWILGVAPLLSLHYGLEIFERVYGFSLIPVCIIICLYSNSIPLKRLIIPILMFLLIFIHIPAHYGSESCDMTLSSELRGANFFADYAKNETYLYLFPSLIRYYNYHFTTTPANTIDWSNPAIDFSISDNRYVINSKRTYNFLKYHVGSNPLDNEKMFMNHDTIYNSRSFIIKLLN